MLSEPSIVISMQVRWIRVVYKGFEEYAGDAEWLVTRADSEAFDYVEGFAFVNDVSDPVNGWGSVPILPGSVFDPAKIPAESEPILYCLELALHHNHRGAAGVDEVGNLAHLPRCIRTHTTYLSRAIVANTTKARTYTTLRPRRAVSLSRWNS